PVWMANPVFASLLADYRSRYPEVRFDVDLSGRRVNLVEEGFDLALRATGRNAGLPRATRSPQVSRRAQWAAVVDQDARQALPFRAGKDSDDSKSVANVNQGCSAVRCIGARC